MVLGWRIRRKGGSRHGHKVSELEIPKHFVCPVSLDLMKDPVTLCSGITYDRESIETWLESGNFTCPVTNQILRSFEQIPNHALRKMIQEWAMANQKYGVQRIPTPRIPVMPVEVSEILFRLAASAGRLDLLSCAESVKKIQQWGSESDRNRRCVVANGAADFLAAAFDAFARNWSDTNGSVCGEILSALNWMLPLGEEARKHLGSEASLRCMIWFLQGNNCHLSAKQNSIMALEELLSYGEQHVKALANVDGVYEILLEFIRKGTSPLITKASLMLISYLINSSEKIGSALAEMGLVSLALEILVDTPKGIICERALGVMDGLLGCQKGRKKAYENALTIPVLVKKLLRVSDAATEFSVSVIWKLFKNVDAPLMEKEEEEVRLSLLMVEALQVGAFQKLLLIIQVGCGEQTKEKATELLKLLNPYRPQLECIESVDFKSLQRSF